MKKAYSVDYVTIRLTHERWYHIIENHDELASYFFEVLETIEKPNLIIKGNKGTLKATRNLGRNKWLIVIYKEISKVENQGGNKAAPLPSTIKLLRDICPFF